MTAFLKDVVGYGTHSARPAAGSAGALYFESDRGRLFRDNGTTWDALDPLTTAGDLAYFDGTNHARLPAGTAGQVLTMVSGEPAWAAAGGGGGGGDLTKITSINLNSGAAASIDFTSIAGTYSQLLVVGSVATATGNSADRYLQVRMNADSGANYAYGGTWWNSSTSGSETGATGDTKGILAEMAFSSPNVGEFGQVVLWLPNYANTHSYKACTCDNTHGTASGFTMTRYGVTWAQTTAITRLTFTASTGVNLAQYSVLTLYGLN